MTIMPTEPLERHYFYDDETKIIYYSKPMKDMPYEPSLVYVGSSDNPNIKMAGAYFMRNGKVQEGYKLKPLW